MNYHKKEGDFLYMRMEEKQRQINYGFCRSEENKMGGKDLQVNWKMERDFWVILFFLLFLEWQMETLDLGAN